MNKPTLMKKASIFFLLFSANLTFAQLVDVIDAKSAGIKNYPVVANLQRTEKGECFSYSMTPRDKGIPRVITIEKYSNTDLTVAFKQTIDNFEEKEEIVKIDIKQNRLYVFSDAWIPKEKQKYLNLRILDNTNGKLISEKLRISKLGGENKAAWSYKILFSPDETKLAVISSFSYGKKPQDVKADVYELADFKPIHTFNFPSLDNNILIKTRNYYLANSGDMSYTFLPDIKEKDAAKKESIAFYDSKVKTHKNLVLPMENKVLQNSQTLSHGGNLFIAGMFRDDFKKEDKKVNHVGFFCVTLNTNDLSVKNSSFDYLSPEVEKKLTYKNKAREKDLIDKTFDLKKLVPCSDGLYIIENAVFLTEHQGTSVNYTYVKYYSRELLVSKYNNEGKQEFISIIPKYTGGNMYDLDFIESNNNLYFFYGEHPKNLERYTVDNFDLSDYEDVGDLNGPVIVCVKMDPKGKLARQMLYRNERLCYAPGTGLQLKNGDLVVMQVAGKEYNLEVFRIKK
jgi:hypothetical protein